MDFCNIESFLNQAFCCRAGFSYFGVLLQGGLFLLRCFVAGRAFLTSVFCCRAGFSYFGVLLHWTFCNRDICVWAFFFYLSSLSSISSLYEDLKWFATLSLSASLKPANLNSEHYKRIHKPSSLFGMGLGICLNHVYCILDNQTWLCFFF